jgi:divalent metal cation (Fe/Co/Zn/Cd) transporter
MGPDYILVNISVDFADSTVAEEIEKAIDKLDLEIKQQFPNVKRVFIEAEKRQKKNLNQGG